MNWRTEIVTGGPRTEKTRALWIQAENDFLLNGHPADCPMCKGANDPDVILANHLARWEELSRLTVEAEQRAEEARKRYYRAGYHLLVNGVPVRCAEVAATFKNKRALHRGTGRQNQALALEAAE